MSCEIIEKSNTALAGTPITLWLPTIAPYNSIASRSSSLSTDTDTTYDTNSRTSGVDDRSRSLSILARRDVNARNVSSKGKMSSYSIRSVRNDKKVSESTRLGSRSKLRNPSQRLLQSRFRISVSITRLTVSRALEPGRSPEKALAASWITEKSMS